MDESKKLTDLNICFTAKFGSKVLTVTFEDPAPAELFLAVKQKAVDLLKNRKLQCIYIFDLCRLV